MRTLTLFLAGLLSLAATAANQVPNGDFEHWRTDSYALPSGFLYASNLDRFYYPALPYNVEQTTDAVQGQFAVKLTTGLPFGDSPNFGYLLNFPADDNTPVGLPINETPTGIRGYYKYLPVDGDSGVILVRFLKEGSKLAEYNFTLKGEQSTYARFEFPFDIPLTQVPDIIQIGFASSFNEAFTGNTGTVLYLDSIGLTGVGIQPQGLAGDFETWTFLEHNLPMAWSISGQAKNSQPKSTVRMSGEYALELRSFLGEEDGIQQAEHRSASLGYWNDDIGDYSGRMPLSGSEDTLSFYYTFQPGIPGDSCQVNIMLYKGTEMINFINRPLNPSQGYRPMRVPLHLHEPFSQQADSLVIEFVSGLWSDREPAAAGSILLVDAVSLLDYKGEDPNDPNDPPLPVIPITETTLFPNGGFEAWDELTVDYPTNYWFNSNSLLLRRGGKTMNVQQTTNAQHGNYALRLISQPTEWEFNFGFVMNANGGEGDPSTWLGGFPIQGRPTGISGHYMYNEGTNDSAMIIVSFNKNGQVLHTYMLPLAGPVTSYTPFNITFDPPLAEDPDSMVLAIASTSHLDGEAWPGSELIIDNISINGLTNQPAGMNGDFEDWQSETHASPIGWYYENWHEGGFSRTNEAAEGQYAIKLTTTLETNDQEEGLIAVGGAATNGYWDKSSDCERGGVAFSNTKDTLVFMYKYIPADSYDRGIVVLTFKREGNNLWDMTVGLNPSNTYKKASIPIHLYQNSWMPRPDTVIVSFRSSHWENSEPSFAGAQLWVDDIHFASEFYLPPPYNPHAPNPPIPNGSFEQWKTSIYETPTNYPYTTDKQMQPWLGLDPFVMKTTDAHNGQYALKLTSRAFSEEAIPGFISNFNVDEGELFDWHGGIPIQEKPTGLKGYYRYNMGAEDTAMIVAVFSKAGVNIGTYFIKLEGPKATYSLFDHSFDPPLAETPDSMILAIASSLVVYEHAHGGSELYLDQLELTGVTQQPPLMNGDFEDWLSESSESPLSWASMGLTGTVSKSAVAIDGQYALSLRTIWEEADSLLIPGMVISSTVPVMYSLSEGGFPLTNMKDTLAFYYRYTPVQQDEQAIIAVYMAATTTEYWNDKPMFTPLRSRAALDVKMLPNRMNRYVWSNELQLAPCSTYQYMEIPFDLTQSQTIPDRMIIMAMSTTYEGNDATYAGSELLLDNFHFRSSSWPVGVKTINTAPAISLYPNPARGLTHLVDPQGLYERIEVYNLMGQRVKSFAKDKGTTELDLDLSNQPAGLYLVRASHNGQKTTIKLVLK